MPSEFPSPETRKRIQQAFDPDLLRVAGHRLIDEVSIHLKKVQQTEGKVLEWCSPEHNKSEAARWVNDRICPSNDPEALIKHFTELIRTAMNRGINLHDPRYIGHQVPPPVPLAGLMDALGSITNQVMAIYEMGPWATSVESVMIDKLGMALGWKKDSFSGLVTHGGSLANLTGLLTARNVMLKDSWKGGLPQYNPDKSPVVVTHQDAHYSTSRAVGILGIGTSQVVKVGLDSKRHMDPIQLDEILARLRKNGRPIVAVCACACATPIGAFDPLPEISEICRRHEVWLHVDAAHGGAAVMSPRYRHLVSGLDRADSIVWDAHKMMHVPALCAFVLYRNREHRFEAFQQDAPYLFDPTAPGQADYDAGMKTIECTKRAAVFGLWGIWSLWGSQLFADLVEMTFDLASGFYEQLMEAEDFQPLHEPECNIVVFQYLPKELKDSPIEEVGEFQLKLRRRIVESGQFYIVSTRLDGTGALRVAIMNPLTTKDHFSALLEGIRVEGKKITDEVPKRAD